METTNAPVTDTTKTPVTETTKTPVTESIKAPVIVSTNEPVPVTEAPKADHATKDSNKAVNTDDSYSLYR